MPETDITLPTELEIESTSNTAASDGTYVDSVGIPTGVKVFPIPYALPGFNTLILVIILFSTWTTAVAFVPVVDPAAPTNSTL